MFTLLTLGFAATLLTLAFFRPMWALVAVILMFPFEQLLQSQMEIFNQHRILANGMVGVAALGAVVTSLMMGRPIARHAISFPLLATLALFAFSALSYLWTSNPEFLASYMQNGLPYLVLVVCVAPLLLTSVDDLAAFSVRFMLASVVLVTLMLISPEFQLRSARLTFRLDAREVANPLALGNLGGAMLVVSALSYSKGSELWLTILRGSCIVLGLGLALLSGSRGQVLAAVFVSFVLFPVGRNLKDFRGLATVAAGFGSLLVLTYFARSLFVSDANADRWSAVSLVGGGAGRLENAVDLIGAYLNAPHMWLTGLGGLSFGMLPSRTGDGYSHVFVADLLGELGLIGVFLGVSIAIAAAMAVRSLLALVGDDPRRRANVTMLVGLLCYEFLLANKQGTLWGTFSLFAYAILLFRLFRFESESQEGEATDDMHADSLEGAADADSEHAALDEHFALPQSR